MHGRNAPVVKSVDRLETTHVSHDFTTEVYSNVFQAISFRKAESTVRIFKPCMNRKCDSRSTIFGYQTKLF